MAQRLDVQPAGDAPAAARDAVNAIARRFAEVAAAGAGRCAIADDEGRSLTYGELASRSARLAGVLERAGAGPGTLVGVHLDRGVPMVLALVAVATAGAAYVPLPVEYPPVRLAEMVADSGVRVVVTGAARRAATGAWFGGVTVDAGDLTVSGSPAPAGDGAADPAAAPLACLLYTSGSTGRPKGIGVSADNVLHLVAGCSWVDLASAPVVAQVSNAAFDALTFEVWGALLNGGTLRVVTGVLSAVGPKLALAAGGRGSVAFLTTSLFNRLAHRAPAALHGVGTLLFGGELSDASAATALLGSGFAGRLVHVYGPTETTTFATYWDVDLAAAPDTPYLPVGVAVPGADVSVRDGDGRRLPPGAEGEVWIGGNGVATGYWGMPGPTRERFVDDGGRTAYRSGDVGETRLAGGREVLVVKGRLDDQIKLRGYRIEPGEVESALRRERVTDAVVTTVHGPSGPLLAAFVTGSRLGPDDLRRRLADVLPPYLVPDLVVPLAEIPLTPNGKADRAALRSLAGRAGVREP